MLDGIKSGRVEKPFLGLIYGPDACGKTTAAAGAPSPIFIETEEGSNFLDVARFQRPSSFSEVMQMLSELINEKHDFKTLVIDSLDFLEPLIWKHVCQKHNWNSIEDAGFGKGYVYALDAWIEFLSTLTEIREKRGMNIILICHSMIRTFNDPNEVAPYDRYQLKLQEKAAGKIREFVDFVGFANYEIFTKAVKDGQKTKAFGTDERKLFGVRTASYDAKSRFGYPKEGTPLSWSAIEKVFSGITPENLRASIKAICALKKDATLVERILAATTKAGEDAGKLQKILEKAEQI
jgi:hypothetical protein